MRKLIAVLTNDDLEKYGGKWGAAFANVLIALIGAFFFAVGGTSLISDGGLANPLKATIALVGAGFGLFMVLTAGAIICELTRQKK